MKKINIETINSLLSQAEQRQSFIALPKGDTFKDLSTICVLPIPAENNEKSFLNCHKCKAKNEYISSSITGLHPRFVNGFYKNLMRPMNVPFLEMPMVNYEVGDAYTTAVEVILNTPKMRDFKYLLTIEWDNIIPYVPGTQGPLMKLYEDIEKGFDVVGGLYWTKGTPSLPLIYGDPKENSKEVSGMFKVRHDWKEGELVECNGMGMGFTLFKMDIFRDKRVKKPWFKTVTEQKKKGPAMYTQDLYFFEKIRKLGYRVAVDTSVKVGHLDFKTGAIY